MGNVIFSFGFARVSEVRHILIYLDRENVECCRGDFCADLVTQYVDGNHPVSS